VSSLSPYSKLLDRTLHSTELILWWNKQNYFIWWANSMSDNHWTIALLSYLELSITCFHVTFHCSIMSGENRLLMHFRWTLDAYQVSCNRLIQGRCGILKINHSCTLWSWNRPNIGFPSTLLHLHQNSKVVSQQSSNNNDSEMKTVKCHLLTLLVILRKPSLHDQS